MKKILYCLIALILFMSSASAVVVDFVELYQDYNDTWHKYTDENLAQYPMFLRVEGVDYRYFTIGNDIVTIPKIMDVTVTERKISPSMTFPKTQLATRMINYNATVAYLVFPYSLSRVKDWGDAHNIKLGRWKFDTAISIHDSNETTFDPAFYDFRIVDDEIRLYFIKSEANKLVGNITFQMNSWTVDNATTSGWSTANVSLNGSMVNDAGTLSIITNHTINDGLVAYWGFNGNVGTNAYNQNNANGSVNVTNAGTLVGMNTGLNNCTGNCSGWNSSGIIGNALAFDGVDDYVDAGDNASLRVESGSFTVSVWVNPAVVQQQVILFKGSLNINTGYVLIMNRFGSDITLTKGGVIDQAVTYTFQANKWYYIVAVQPLKGYVIYYINGVSIGSYSNTANYISSSGQNFYIGDVNTFFAKKFNGSIDEVRIYNRALSAEEIAVMYNTSLRTQAMPLILNQTASTGYKPQMVRIASTGHDSLNNISLYGNASGVSGRSLIQSNVNSGTWYTIPSSIQNQTMDFAIEMNGNGSLTTFLTSLEWSERLLKHRVI